MKFTLNLRSIGPNQIETSKTYISSCEFFPDCDFEVNSLVALVRNVKSFGVKHWTAGPSVRLWNLYESAFQDHAKHHYIAFEVVCAFCDQVFQTTPTPSSQISGCWPVFVDGVNRGIVTTARRKEAEVVQGKPDCYIVRFSSTCKECIVHRLATSYCSSASQLEQ
uniref:ORF1 n=1 Tax=Sowbane mosaic virus TaxID=378833 RepID=E0YU12_9VIRU|nr:ORF1 [Sowbane mosaic virus]